MSRCRSAVVPVVAVSACALLGIPVFSQLQQAWRQRPGWDANRTKYLLPNGWTVSPMGTTIDLPGDMPGNIVFLDGGKKALVNTCGFHDHSLNLLDLDGNRITQTVPLARAWVGLATTPTGEVFLSGGRADDAQKTTPVLRFKRDGDTLTAEPGITDTTIPAKERYISSIVTGPQGIYTLNIQNDTVIRYSVDGKPQARAKVGYRPYGAALSPDGATLAVTNWGDQSVSFLDATTLQEKQRIAVGPHPSSIVAGPDGRWFVTDAGADTIHILAGGKVQEVVRVSLGSGETVGPTPVCAALAPDAKTLYVANAGENTVAVLDIRRTGHTHVKGHIPTDRYPTLVGVSPDGKLVIGTAKGTYGPNGGAAVPADGKGVRGKELKNPFLYIGNQLAGRLRVLPIPNDTQLAAWTRQAKANVPTGEGNSLTAPERRDIREKALRNIKHVIYVIRENRTFDQVLGDIGRGECDPSLTLFGKQVTPNGHTLANTFVLLDNLYTDGEVSQAGHQWTDAAFANDYCEKQWILGYSRHGEVASDMRLTSSPGEYIWSLARKKGRTARVYGEYVDRQEDHDSLSEPLAKADPEKFGYSASFEAIFARGGRDPEKVADFVREMRAAETTGNWPNLMVMALPEDHTHGLRAGEHSPRAMVASNDQAIGQLVEAVSHSKFWKETAIFIIQDDGQDGPDHIDSHRTVGLVISPYTRRGALVRQHYTTSSMLRTMELILGLPPMTTYDAAATPMYACFTTTPDFTPYTCAPAEVDIEERNPPATALARRSAKLDFSEVDRADFDELNHILWEAYKPGVPYPEHAGKRSLSGP